MPDNEGVGIGELSRQVQGVLLRFEGLATKLEQQFVRTDNYLLYQRLVDEAIAGLKQTMATLASSDQLKNVTDDVASKASKGTVEALTDRVEALEDDKKWLIRLVLGFIVMGILGTVFVVSKGSGA